MSSAASSIASRLIEGDEEAALPSENAIKPTLTRYHGWYDTIPITISAPLAQALQADTAAPSTGRLVDARIGDICPFIPDIY